MTESPSPTESTDDEVGAAEAESPIEQRTRRRRTHTPSTPFDYPLVSPIFLLVLAVWFGYDGWFNPEIKSKMFNKIVFGFLVVGALWTLSVDLKIMKIQRARKEAAEKDAAAQGNAEVSSES